MSRIMFDLNDRELREAREAKDRLGKTWRAIVLESLNIEETPRSVGKPRTLT